jgi:hypothetical protein
MGPLKNEKGDDPSRPDSYGFASGARGIETKGTAKRAFPFLSADHRMILKFRIPVHSDFL